MAFIKATQCAAGTKSRFPAAEVTVSLSHPEGSKEKPSIQVGIKPDALPKAMLVVGDRVDVAYDPDLNRMQVELVKDDAQPSACTLSQLGGKKRPAATARIAASITIRAEWGLKPEHSIPIMPCTRVGFERGVITFDLPESYRKLRIKNGGAR